MREIKFRYKTRSGKLVCGYRPPFEAEVEPTTIGQFSGLLDCEGKEIYEGDIVQTTIIDGYGSDREIIGRVVFKEGCFDIVEQEDRPGFVGRKYRLYGAYNVYKTMRIVGNIYDEARK